MPCRVKTPVCSASSSGVPACSRPPMPAVLAFGVLAHADHVDVGGAAVGQRRGDAGQQPHRPQVDVLAEPLAQRQDQVARRDVVGDARVADGAEVDRVELHARCSTPSGVHHPAVSCR